MSAALDGDESVKDIIKRFSVTAVTDRSQQASTYTALIILTVQ